MNNQFKRKFILNLLLSNKKFQKLLASRLLNLQQDHYKDRSGHQGLLPENKKLDQNR